MIIINASYSNVSVTYIADGTQTVFSFPFDYLRKAFVKVEINEETILIQGDDYSVSDKTVTLFTAPAAETIVRIFRETSTTRLVSWADASVLRAKDMTIQQVQNLHILEEQQYWTSEYAISRDGREWNARNFPIKNVEDPVNPKDAANKEYVDSTSLIENSEGTAWEGKELPIKHIGNPVDPKDAATKEYVDNMDAADRQYVNDNALLKTSTGTAWEGRGLPIKRIDNPVENFDAATKQYVDEQIEDAPDSVKNRVFEYIDGLLADSGDGTFQYDHYLDLMPTVYPVGSSKWDIDVHGDIMPKDEVVI